MQINKTIATTLIAVYSSFTVGIAHAQFAGSPTNTLRNPLIPGASSAPPLVSAPVGQPPACGDGAIPAPVTIGMPGPPTLLPYVPTTPSNDIQNPSYVVPFSPATVSLPGQLGPSIYAPPPPSTPGFDPGIITHPRDFYPPPASIGTVMPGGGIAGFAPTTRWGGQTSRDFGRYKYHGTRSFDFGQKAFGSTSQDGPWQNRYQGTPTYDLYGSRQNHENNSSSIMTIAPY